MAAIQETELLQWLGWRAKLTIISKDTYYYFTIFFTARLLQQWSLYTESPAAQVCTVIDAKIVLAFQHYASSLPCRFRNADFQGMAKLLRRKGARASIGTV